MRQAPALLFLLAAASAAALAETPYERDQREQLEQYQRQHGLSPQQQQAQRWQREWREQHPGEPLPSFGALEKLHRAETQQNINQGFAQMRQRRQAELRQEYLLSRQQQERRLAAQHVTWTAAQWQNWDHQYDLAKQQQAKDYLEGERQAGEIFEAQRKQEESEKLWKDAR